MCARVSHCPVCFADSVNVFQVSYQNRGSGYIPPCRFILGCQSFSANSSCVGMLLRFLLPLPLRNTLVELLTFLKYHFPTSLLLVTGAEEKIGTDWIPPPFSFSLFLSLPLAKEVCSAAELLSLSSLCLLFSCVTSRKKNHLP